MDETTDNKKPKKVGDRRVHMANERTFLAWIRTSIGMMAFGFVFEKFSLFIKQISISLGNPAYTKGVPSYFGFSSVLGIVLVAIGALMGLLAFIRYKKVEREIEEDTYKPSIILDILITVAILAIGIFFTIYMIYNI